MNMIKATALMLFALLALCGQLPAADNVSQEEGILLRLNLTEGMKWQEDFTMDFRITSDASSMEVTKQDLEELIDELPEPKTEKERTQMEAIRQFLAGEKANDAFLTLEMNGQREHQVQSAVPGEDYSLSSMLKMIKMSFGGFMVPGAEIDSEVGESSSSGLDAMLLMLDQELILQVEGNGKITSVSGLDTVIDKARTAYADNPELQIQIVSMLKEQRDQFTMQDMAPYPEYPVKPGDTWTIDFPIQLSEAGSQTSNLPVEMTLIKREDGKAYLKGLGSLLVNMEKGLGEPVPIELLLDLTVDEETGLSLEMKMEMTSQMQSPGEKAEDMQQFDSHMKMTMTNTPQQ